MAAGDARDLELRLVTRDEVDTSAAVREVDNLAEAVDDTARRLDDQTDAAQRAERAVDDLGDSSRSAAGDVDQLGRASDDAGRNLGDGVEEGAGRGAEAVDSFKDEAAASIMELAGSWDGTLKGMVDVAQGAAPALGAAFGPVGLAIGSAVGLGIGFATAQTEKLKEAASSLTASLIADGGRIQRESVLAKVAEFAEDGSIEDLARQAREAKVDVDDYVLAVAGDPDAIKRVQDATDAYTRSVAYRRQEEANAANAAAGYATGFDEQGQAVNRIRAELEGQGDALAAATARYELYAGAQDAATGSSEEALAVQEGLTAALDDAATGAADLAEAIGAGADAVEEALNRQLEAQANFEANTQAVYDRLGEQGVAFATAQGDNAAEAMALLAAAPAEQGDRIVAAWTALGNTTGASIAAGINASAPAAAEALLGVIEGLQYTADRARPINVRVRTDPSGLNELETIVRTGKVRQ